MYTDEEEIQWTELLLEVAPSNSTGILAPGTLEAEIDCGWVAHKLCSCSFLNVFFGLRFPFVS